MRIGAQAQSEMKKAIAGLLRPRAYGNIRPITDAEEQAAKQQAYGRIFPTNPVVRSAPLKGRIPHSINRLAKNGRFISPDDTDPILVAKVLRAKGGWRPYDDHTVKSAVYVRPDGEKSKRPTATLSTAAQRLLARIEKMEAIGRVEKVMLDEGISTVV